MSRGRFGRIDLHERGPKRGESGVPYRGVQAPAYGFHVAQNHPFVDGNKRAALAAMLVFLEINGHSLRVPQEDLYAMMISLASGRLSKAGLTAWLRERLGLTAEGSRSE